MSVSTHTPEGGALRVLRQWSHDGVLGDESNSAQATQMLSLKGLVRRTFQRLL